MLLDEEVHRLVDEAHAGVAQPLSEHRDELDNLAHPLLQPETLNAAGCLRGRRDSDAKNRQFAT